MPTSTRPDVRLSPSGRPVTRPADQPDAISAGVGDKQQCGDALFDATRGIELGNAELTLIERILSEAGGGEVILRIATIIERSRRAERRSLVPDDVISEKLAAARADERAVVEAEAAEDWRLAEAEIQAAHRAELAKLREAWGVVSAGLG